MFFFVIKMKSVPYHNYVLCLCLCIFAKTTASNSTTVQLLSNTSNSRVSYFRTIEEDLLRHNWEEDEQPCLRQLLKVIRNVQNSTLWATWIWDSMQFPVGQLYGSRAHLGNYDQCLNLPWKDYPELRTQYCLAEIDLFELDSDPSDVDLHEPVQKFLKHKTKHSLRYNTLLWGICSPQVCEPESVTKFAAAMFRSSHLGQMEDQVNVTVNPAFCHVSGVEEVAGYGEYILLPLVIIVTIMALLCTFYMNLKEFETSSDFVKAFYIKSNAQWLMKAEDQSVRSALGVRVISTYFILMGHLWLVKNMFGVSNAGEIDKIWDNPLRCVMFNIDMVVDTFFMMSGLLLTKALVERKTINFNPLGVISRRYIRLVRSIFLVLLVLPIVVLRGDPAPLVKKFLQREVDLCATNWWKAVLMIGNYGDTENMCYPILWSLATDFHLFIVGVLIFYVYHKSKSAGIKAYIVGASAAVLMPILHGYIHHSAAIIKFDFRVSDDFRKYPVADPSYVSSHLRAGPYFVGMAIGYLMALYQPEKHRNVISKKTSMLGFLSFLGAFALLIISSGKFHVSDYTPLEGAIFSVVRRNVFVSLIGSLILICEYGDLPIISGVFSWSGLVPLSKLSYGVYLTHFMFLFRYVSRTRVPLRSDVLDDIYATFGYMALSLTLSLLMFLFWEAPMSNLLKIMSKRTSAKKELNGKIETNGRTNGKLHTEALEGDELVDNKLYKKAN